MKKSLIWAFAALAFAACSNPDMNGNDAPVHSGEIETSYIAINLSASDITRAQDGGFADGEAAERAVHHADFFFFDGDGNAFNVTGNPATQPGGGINHLQVSEITFTPDANNGDDISDSSAPVLLLQTYKGEYPSQIVAVLNWSPGDKAYSLEELKLAVDITQEWDATDYFVMSNAVYAQGTTEVYATPLTIDNIKDNAEDAKGAPVTIYVERVAAKVSVNANEKYDLGKTYIPTDGTAAANVYAQIDRWDLYRDNAQSKLLKDIDGTWTVDEIGFAWNDSPWYRSYWATSLAAPDDDAVYGTHNFAVGSTAYIGENTTTENTKVVIKAQLVNAAGNPVEIAHWKSVQYTGNVALRTAVANTLKNTYYAQTTNEGVATYTSLKPEDLKCVAGDIEGVKANEVYFQLSEAGVAKNWYKLVNGVYEPVAADTANDSNSVGAMNTALKGVPSAVLYTNGETFYYVDIEHLGVKGKPAHYGIVRNHAYNITINSIKGWGSPVYEGNTFIDYPDTPEQSTYVSAKINILSWRLVNQSVDIQPAN